MLKRLITEMRKLPDIITRQEIINWYLDNFKPAWGSKSEITTGELIELAKKVGKKVQGQSKLAIHITVEEEKEFMRRSKAELTKKRAHASDKIPDSEREKIQDMYWRCGMSLDNIATRYGCASSTIQKRMRDWQLETRSRGSNILTSTKSRGIRVGV